jgi:hypothetical protein
MTMPRLSRSLHLIVLSLILAGCAAPTAMAPTPTASPTVTVPSRTALPTITPRPSRTKAPTWTRPSATVPSLTSTPVPPQGLSLRRGEYYFRWDGRPRFFLTRNLGGNEEAQFGTFLDGSVAGGSQIVRLSLETLGMGFTTRGGINEAWARQWERIFTQAEADGIYVIPVLGNWSQWSGSGPNSWAYNPMNYAKGGQTRDPLDLFKAGSDTQILYMSWIENLVKRWEGIKNIAAWEVYSELDRSPASETACIDFVNEAARRIRLADPSRRPVTASLADAGTWTNFYAKTKLDIIQVHPYPASGQLDRAILEQVRQALDLYKLPVFIGESGLSAEAPDSPEGSLSVAKNSGRGLSHAIWAAVVSGAMNGRSFWWEDSFGLNIPSLGLPWMQKFQAQELPAVNFVSGVDFSAFVPVPAETSADVWGAAVGNETLVLGWFRDAACEPPDWPVRKLAGQSVTLTLPGPASQWRVDFYDTSAGTDLVSSADLSASGGSLVIPLPDFNDDIAFKLTATGQ